MIKKKKSVTLTKETTQKLTLRKNKKEATSANKARLLTFITQMSVKSLKITTNYIIPLISLTCLECV